jgi:hypothetical protein
MELVDRLAPLVGLVSLLRDGMLGGAISRFMTQPTNLPCCC